MSHASWCRRAAPALTALASTMALTACSFNAPASGQTSIWAASTEVASRRQQDRAQAVLYRWFYFYETTQPDFEAQYAILADDVSIQGAMSVNSLAEYKASLTTPYFVFGQNAHHVERVTFDLMTPETTSMTVAILYQGIDKAGVTHAYRIIYAIVMVEDGAPLPKIKAMTMRPVGAAEPAFEPTYEHNRAQAEVFEQRANSSDFYQ